MTYSRSADPNSKLGRIILRIFLVLGILLLIASVILLVVKNRQLKGMVRTEAMIVDHYDDHGDMGTVISYRVDNQSYTYTFSSYSRFDKTGDTIEIAYDPDAPEQPVLTGFMGYFAPIMLAFLGVGFTAVSTVISAIISRKKEPKDETPIWERT